MIPSTRKKTPSIFTLVLHFRNLSYQVLERIYIYIPGTLSWTTYVRTPFRRYEQYSQPKRARYQSVRNYKFHLNIGISTQTVVTFPDRAMPRQKRAARRDPQHFDAAIDLRSTPSSTPAYTRVAGVRASRTIVSAKKSNNAGPHASGRYAIQNARARFHTEEDSRGGYPHCSLSASCCLSFSIPLHVRIRYCCTMTGGHS